MLDTGLGFFIDCIQKESHSRLTITQQNLKADPIAHSLAQMLEPFAPELRQSITFNNPILSACKAVEGGSA